MTIEQAPLSRDALPPGSLVPGDAGYDEARISFNGMLDRRPAAIVPCTTTAEVQAAVRAARAADLPIAVRGGGHSVAGHGIADGALMVSLAGMRTVTVDPAGRTADAGGGALWEDVDGATTAHGLAVPGGTFVDTGIGGLTLGGGLGWLMPLAGLTCDNLVAAEVVTADGSVAIAGDGGDPDLLWALRGGGGNFGVVTRFTYRLIPVGPIFGGRLLYPATAAAEVLARIERIVDEHPTATMPTLTIRRNPDFGHVIGVLLGIVDGSDPEPILRILRDDLPRVADEVGPMTYPQLQAITGLIPFGVRHYWKGHFLRGLDGATLAAVADAAGASDAVGSSFVLIEGIVGAGRTEPPGGAAFGQRAARWNASALAMWDSPADDETAVGWARRVADLLAGASLSGGGYVNYSPVDETVERIRATYGADRWTRLVAVKRRYDPDNVFRYNHNIAPG
ncbi:MAG TPA: FAD-binding oxidoreductase [Candidatus Limnocylindrales bacterium]|nr:FAD-binding oxidoreductase [Candidatus Limnocylindrales bacterium]